MADSAPSPLSVLLLDRMCAAMNATIDEQPEHVIPMQDYLDCGIAVFSNILFEALQTLGHECAIDVLREVCCRALSYAYRGVIDKCRETQDPVLALLPEVTSDLYGRSL